MATATAEPPRRWSVRCDTCRVTVAEGEGQGPTQVDLTGHGEAGTVDQKIQQHLREASGVHRLTVVNHGRVTE